MLLLGSCGRVYTERPEIKTEIENMHEQGWDFVEMVGEAHSTPVSREVRLSDASGSLTVHAGNTGVDGYGDRSQSFDKIFKKDGLDFLEVKIMTSPADGYCLVFQKPQEAINNSASTPQKNH